MGMIEFIKDVLAANGQISKFSLIQRNNGNVNINTRNDVLLNTGEEEIPFGKVSSLLSAVSLRGLNIQRRRNAHIN